MDAGGDKDGILALFVSGLQYVPTPYALDASHSLS